MKLKLLIILSLFSLPVFGQFTFSNIRKAGYQAGLNVETINGSQVLTHVKNDSMVMLRGELATGTGKDRNANFRSWIANRLGDIYDPDVFNLIYEPELDVHINGSNYWIEIEEKNSSGQIVSKILLINENKENMTLVNTMVDGSKLVPNPVYEKAKQNIKALK